MLAVRGRCWNAESSFRFDDDAEMGDDKLDFSWDLDGREVLVSSSDGGEYEGRNSSFPDGVSGRRLGDEDGTFDEVEPRRDDVENSSAEPINRRWSEREP